MMDITAMNNTRIAVITIMISLLLFYSYLKRTFLYIDNLIRTW